MLSYSKVLVTGGSGFIGSHIVDQLLSEGVEVIVLDSLLGGRKENIKKHADNRNLRFVRGDIRNAKIVCDLLADVEVIIHLAALVSVSLSMKEPVLVNNINVGGTVNLLKAALKSSVKRFVYASSCAIYGDADVLPVKENYTPRPTSPYGVSKLAAEEYVNVFHKISGLETFCLRFFNVFGPRQLDGDYSGVITQFISRLVDNRPLVIFGDGEQTRDFVHVRDVTEATMLALKTAETGGETFNIGSGVATTINKLASLMLEVTGKTGLRTIFSEPRRGDIRNSVADISKARESLHYKPNTQLKADLKALIESHGI